MTRFVDFRFDNSGGSPPETEGTSFTFLGFCHVWGRTRRGGKAVRQVTAKNRYARALAAITDWCRTNRHDIRGELALEHWPNEDASSLVGFDGRDIGDDRAV